MIVIQSKHVEATWSARLGAYVLEGEVDFSSVIDKTVIRLAAAEIVSSYFHLQWLPAAPGNDAFIVEEVKITFVDVPLIYGDVVLHE